MLNCRKTTENCIYDLLNGDIGYYRIKKGVEIMKELLIIHSNMELGGAETSLIGLLQNIDYSEWNVDLMLLEQKGELMEQILDEVNLLQPDVSYQCLAIPIKDVLLKKGNIGITAARIYGKIKGRKYADRTYAVKQFAHHAALRFLPEIPGCYDLAISFIDPHFILTKKVNAKCKIGWFHTDFSRIEPNGKLEHEMWSGCDYIVNVSESTKSF